MNNRNFGLDLLRAAAILAVVMFHSAPTLDLPRVVQTISAHGWVGVDLFFVLSGYLIGLQVFSATPRPSESFWSRCTTFWIKRWTRTVPLYAVVLFFYVVLKPRIFHVPFTGGFDWKWLFFLQNYGDIQDFGQTWSLCIEEQFYFVFPLIVFTIPVIPRLLWLTPVALSVALRYWFTTRHADPVSGQVLMTQHDYLNVFRFFAPAMLDAISIGVFLASCRSTWSAWRGSLRLACAVPGLVLLLGIAVLVPDFPTSPLQITFTYTGLALAFGSMLVAAEQWQLMPRGLSVVRWTALCSYSTYLLHELLLKFFYRYGQGPHWYLHLLVFTGLVGAVSLASYEWIEKPGMRLRNLLGQRRAVQPTPDKPLS